MNIVLNAEKLNLDAAGLEMLAKRAELHRRFSAIEFKVLEKTADTVVVRIVQEKSFHGNYFDAKRLVEIAHETFDDLLPGLKVLPRPIPYKPSPPDIVTSDWVKKKSRKADVR